MIARDKYGWREVSQALAITELQFKLLLHKRIVLALVIGWILQLLVIVSARSSIDPSFGYRVTSGVTDWLVILMASGVIADDAERGTFSLVLSHGIERSVFMAGKLSSIVAIALLFSLLGQVVTIWLIVRGDATVSLAVLGPRIIPAVCLSLVRILVVATATACVAVAATNRHLAALGAFVYVYGLSLLVRRIFGLKDVWLGIVDSFLPWRSDFDRVVASAFSSDVEIGRLAAATLQPLLYAILFGVLALRLLERRDLADAHV